MTVRRLGVDTSLMIATTVFGLWIMLLYLFWYFYIGNNIVQSNERNSAAVQDPTVIAEEIIDWRAKIKKDVSSDFRLPVTIVTGFL
jgi:hypothetical protein